MSGRADLILLYDGSFEGLLSAVFASYSCSPPPQALDTAEFFQPRLDCDCREVPTDPRRAARVIAGVRREMGELGYRKIWQAFLYDGAVSTADGGNKATVLYRYIRLGMRAGKRIHQMLTHPAVMAIDKLCALTGREATFLTEFIRFSELEGHLYYAEITPEHCALPLIMPHFAARMNTLPFLIHDKTHRLAGVYDRQSWVLVSAEDIHIPALSADEEAYRRLWRGFYDAVAIQERRNPALRQKLMPKKYWKNMTEWQPSLSSASPLSHPLSSAPRDAARETARLSPPPAP